MSTESTVPRVSDEAIEGIAKSQTLEARFLIAMHPVFVIARLRYLAKRNKRETCAGVATHPLSKPALLSRLLQSEFVAVWG